MTNKDLAMINNSYITLKCAAALLIVALTVPSLSYCATRAFVWRPDCLNFADSAKSSVAEHSAKSAQASSKADFYLASNSQSLAEQEAQRLGQQERAKLDRQRQLEMEVIKNMQQLDTIDAENRKRELEEERLLLQRLAPGTKQRPVRRIGPNK